MNISLTSELDIFVKEKVQTGMYHSASEVIREGLRLLRQQDEIRQAQIAQLTRDVKIGVDQIDRGELTTYETTDLADLSSEIKTRGREEMRKRSNSR